MNDNNDYGYSGSYVYHPENNGPTVPIKVETVKPKKTVPVTVVVICLVICLIVSTAAGLTGGILAGKYFVNVTTEQKTKKPSETVIKKDISQIITESDGSGNELPTPLVVEKTADSVVVITTEQVVTDNWLGNYIKSGAGSGVIIEASGYIVTCNHVIENAKTIEVTLRDGTVYDATLIGGDSKTDIALIKIDAADLTVATFGSSADLLVGETAIAIGNPLGVLGGTVTKGIISALDRKVSIDGRVFTLLQTDAAVNHGNSGGALFDGKGDLVGIVNGGASGEEVDGLGFAIPVDLVKTIVPDLYEYGYVKNRPSLGLSLLEISDSITALRYRVNYLGVYVLSDSGDFLSGDLIVSIDDNTSVSTLTAIDTLLDGYNIGDTVKIKVYRNKSYKEINLSLVEHTPSKLEDM